MAELRGDGGARLIEEKPQMGFNFLTPKFVNLLTPLSLFGAKRYLHYICLLKSFLCHSKTTTWTGGPVLETCCEKNKCKIHQIAILPKEGQRNWKNKIEFMLIFSQEQYWTADIQPRTILDYDIQPRTVLDCELIFSPVEYWTADIQQEYWATHIQPRSVLH